MDGQTSYKSVKISKSVPLDLRLPNNNNNHYHSAIIALPVNTCLNNVQSIARDTTL